MEVGQEGLELDTTGINLYNEIVKEKERAQKQ